ncbi:hypothetical protein ACVWZV_009406 [Bradyrhizobium sp. GM5.1]
MTTRLDFVGDDGLGAATYDFAAKVVAVIPFVAEERAHRRLERQNIWRRDIGILAWCQMQEDRPAERIAQRMYRPYITVVFLI